jgi:hypothetical protein
VTTAARRRRRGLLDHAQRGGRRLHRLELGRRRPVREWHLFFGSPRTRLPSPGRPRWRGWNSAGSCRSRSPPLAARSVGFEAGVRSSTVRCPARARSIEIRSRSRCLEDLVCTCAVASTDAKPCSRAIVVRYRCRGLHKARTLSRCMSGPVVQRRMRVAGRFPHVGFNRRVWPNTGRGTTFVLGRSRLDLVPGSGPLVLPSESGIGDLDRACQEVEVRIDLDSP